MVQLIVASGVPRVAPGPNRGHRYFDLGETLGGDKKVPDNLAELAAKLRTIPWPY